MACMEGKKCRDTLDSLTLDLQNKDIFDFFTDPVLTYIVETLIPPPLWRKEDIPLLQTIKKGGPVLDKDFEYVNSPLGDRFRKIAEKLSQNKLGVYKGKILFQAVVSSRGGKSRRLKKRQRKSEKRRR